MANVRIPKGWEISQRLVTPESVYRNRREFLRELGFAGVGVMGMMAGCAGPSGLPVRAFADIQDLGPFIPKSPTSQFYPAKRNAKYKLDRPLTKELVAARYNNFYEFSLQKDVWRHIGKFEIRPWQIKVKGEVEKPAVFDIDDLVRKFPLEERLYRHRCVEAWSMAVPWSGFPLRSLLEAVQPKASAKYVRFVTFLNPKQAPEQTRAHWYPWPYFEALTIEEAMNELTLLATGIYGHEMTLQHGSPIRLVVPWKYGYKSIKSIVEIELTRKRPPTFWNQLQPREYDFTSNVNPNIPHPRWSQAKETVIDTGEKRPTLLYNGYGEFVAALYS
ncbi:MAG: protein-methionine-sulfoxide reductase catalytic subunit MsrP [Acidobacteriota bacterium]